MASENETVMAVCAEWRDCIESADPSVWNDERIAGLVKTTKAQQIAYLDRIEAAWKREARAIATEHAVLPAVCINKWSVNAAAMREALVEIRDAINKWYEDDYISHGVFSVLWDLCSAALSTPPRNCDRFDNWYDAHQAWERLPKDELGYFVAANGVHECEQAWLFAPAAERKGEGDGR